MIRAIQFTDPEAFRRARLPGSFHIDLTQGGPKCATFWFFCPCGCAGPNRISVGFCHKPAQEPSWCWNGKLSEPTLTPSVNQAVCGWHGWLRDGYWEAA
ncbi:DUF6527 family protein [Roseovarius sp. MBR-6]|jgi:hypothetical protein|uniref:DUF6527 family protein n=1 Tax=Roseovarius sp. MBR-6 TaxID=3156459 RepID=UPI00339867AF